MAIQLYNLLTHAKSPFVPQNPQRVTLYLCGPTVYDVPHLGNGRSAVVFDVLVRLLRHEYGGDCVLFVRNITDVDDKINAAAVERGITIRQLTEETYASYMESMRALGVAAPDIQPRVTDTIPEIIAMIEELVARGHAYVAENHVLFSVSSACDYGRLSGRSLADMIDGARVEIAPYKRDPADFVLWKPSSAELPGWETPAEWGGGRGRPGWHIECSAMIEKHLGLTIDIHGGGNDLIFPHHENERAQSQCAHDGAVLANCWVHNGMLTVDGQKMSKSLGNFVTVAEVLDWGFPGEAIRYTILKSHYRQPMDWTRDGVAQAWKELDSFYQILRRHPKPLATEPNSWDEDFFRALGDDLNTPLALSVLHSLANQTRTQDSPVEFQAGAAKLRKLGEVLGILQADPEQWFTGLISVNPDWIEQRIIDRNEARLRKDFAEADRIRQELLDKGIVLEDTSDKTLYRTLSKV